MKATKCNICKSTKLYSTERVKKGDRYYEERCYKCGNLVYAHIKKVEG